MFWGLFHALLFLPLLTLGKNRRNTNTVAEGRWLPSLKEAAQILFTFFLVVVGWIIFRAPSIGIALDYMSNMVSGSIFTVPTYKITTLSILTFIMLGAEWIRRNKMFALENLEGLVKPVWLRWLFYIFLIFTIIQFGGKSETFIYFQF